MSRRGEGSNTPLSFALEALTAAERQVLAVLAVVGGASFTREALVAAAAIEDFEATVAELERRRRRS